MYATSGGTSHYCARIWNAACLGAGGGKQKHEDKTQQESKTNKKAYLEDLCLGKWKEQLGKPGSYRDEYDSCKAGITHA